MRSSSKNRLATSSARRAAALLLLAAAWAGGGLTSAAQGAAEIPPATGTPAPAPAATPAAAPGFQPIAVLPLENLTGHPEDLAPLQQALRAALEASGLVLLEDATLEAFLEKHRIRWTGGMTAEDSKALLEETGARSALVTTLLVEDPSDPPRIAIAARLVTPGDPPRIAWMDVQSLAGDDAPGFLSLGLVEDPAILQERVLDRIAELLADRAASPDEGAGSWSEELGSMHGRHRPRRWYRSPHLEFASGAPALVAVLPFKDESGRRRGGDVVPLLLVRYLAASPAMDVLEPGSVRETLLQNRVIMEGGVSLAQVEVIRSLLQVDYVVTGTVSELGEFLGRNGSPRVQFTVRVIDARTNQAVWSSISHNEGDDKVVFFGCGRIRSATALASEMARQVAAGFTGSR